VRAAGLGRRNGGRPDGGPERRRLVVVLAALLLALVLVLVAIDLVLEIGGVTLELPLKGRRHLSAGEGGFDGVLQLVRSLRRFARIARVESLRDRLALGGEIVGDRTRKLGLRRGRAGGSSPAAREWDGQAEDRKRPGTRSHGRDRTHRAETAHLRCVRDWPN